MPPIGPLRKDDGPFCRVCGCTEKNACPVDTDHPSKPQFPGGPLGCSWVDTEQASLPLCSACSGTLADMREVIARGIRLMKGRSPMDAKVAIIKRIGAAAIARLDARTKLEKQS